MAANESLEMDELNSSTLSCLVHLQAAVRGELARRVLDDIRQEYELIVADIEEDMAVEWPESFGMPVVRKAHSKPKASSQEAARKRGKKEKSEIISSKENLSFQALERESEKVKTIQQKHTKQRVVLFGGDFQSEKCDKFREGGYSENRESGNFCNNNSENEYENREQTDGAEIDNEIDDSYDSKPVIDQFAQIDFIQDYHLDKSKEVEVVPSCCINNQRTQTEDRLTTKSIDTNITAPTNNNMNLKGDQTTNLNLYEYQDLETVACDDVLSEFGDDEKEIITKTKENSSCAIRASDSCRVSNDIVKSGVTVYESPLVRGRKVHTDSHTEIGIRRPGASHISASHKSLIKKPAEDSSSGPVVGESRPLLVDAAVSPIKTLDLPNASPDTAQSQACRDKLFVQSAEVDGSIHETPALSDFVQVSPSAQNKEEHQKRDNPVAENISASMALGEKDKTSSVENVEADHLPDTKKELMELKQTLTMELLWIQQAINSRQHYLRLKHQMA